MIDIVKKMLLCLVDDIDAGNTNLSEEECLKIIKTIKEYSHEDIEMSKYQAYTYLNISRASFDNLVKNGDLPKGKKVLGFKELRWNKSELDKYAKSRKRNTKTAHREQ